MPPCSGLPPPDPAAWLAAASDVLCLVDQEGRILGAAPSIERLLGLDATAVVGRTLAELGHAEDQPTLHDFLEACGAKGATSERATFRLARPQGGWVWVEAAGSNALADPRLGGLVVSLREVRNTPAKARDLEEPLQESDGRYRILLEHLPEAVMIHARDTTLLMANPRAQGLTDQSLLGRRVEDLAWDLLREDGSVLPAEAHPVRRVLAAGEPVKDEVLGILPKGQVDPQWGLCSAYPLRDSEGQVAQVVMIFQDTTERRRAVQGLRETNEMFSRFMEHSPIHVYIKEVTPSESRVLQASDNFRDMIGLSGADMVGKTMKELFPPEFAAKITADDWAVASAGEILKLDEELNGRSYSTIKFPILVGERVLLAGYTIDITPRREMEEALRAESESLRESVAQNRALLQAIPDLIFHNHRSGEFLAVHVKHTGELLQPPESFLHRNVREVLPDPLASQFMAAIERALDTGAVESFEYELQAKDHEGNFEARVAPCTQDSVITLVRDITQARQSEQRLRQSQKLESLGLLAGGIAHDFNNLLTALMGNLNLAQLKLQAESPAHPNLEAVEKVVVKASDLTRQLLAYSGKGRFVVKPQDLNQVVEEMGHLLKVSISKKVELHLDLAQGLPRMEGDSAQLQQVILNLVTNASDAIGDHEGVIRITTRSETLDASFISQAFPTQPILPGAFVTLMVSDTGCGIPPEVLPKIFDPFFSTKTKGRGLGLSTMHGILRGHRAGL